MSRPPRGSFILPGGKKDHDSRGTPREGSVALRVLAQGAWDHAETQGGTPVACRRDLALDLVQAAQGYTEREALAAVAARSQVMFERAEALAVALARDLERCVPLGMRRTDHPICHLPPDPGWP